MMTNLLGVSNWISSLHHMTSVLEVKFLSEVEDGHPNNSTPMVLTANAKQATSGGKVIQVKLD